LNYNSLHTPMPRPPPPHRRRGGGGAGGPVSPPPPAPTSAESHSAVTPWGPSRLWSHLQLTPF
ncbi:hypothetical protein, partial [Nocardia abscessus]|uniref:hypothetical protein n=1 Tax=Nocardia abscessus TaxID=120957 RepID=UPI0024557255